MDFYDVRIPLDVQPSLVLSVETDELGIAAGLQDRVIQVYGGLVYMDFSRESMVEKNELMCGVYERLDPTLLPPLYLAYSTDVGEPTEVFHNNLRARYNHGEPAVVEAMGEFADLAEQSRTELLAGRPDRLARLIDRNFDLRCTICQLPAQHVEMVRRARRVGASAKFAGSGGAIVGTYRDEAMFGELKRELESFGCHVFKPDIGP
jgi:glucuronokinase